MPCVAATGLANVVTFSCCIVLCCSALYYKQFYFSISKTGTRESFLIEQDEALFHLFLHLTSCFSKSLYGITCLVFGIRYCLDFFLFNIGIIRQVHTHIQHQPYASHDTQGAREYLHLEILGVRPVSK